MTSCPACGAENIAGAQFCTKCGSTLPASSQSAYTPPVSDYSPTGGASSYNQAPMQMQPPQVGIGGKAEPLMRAGSWIIDILALIVCLLPIIIVGWIPIIGWIILWLGIPTVGIAYHLLRDITSTSPGKFLLGMKVVSKNGSEAPNSARVLRNVLFIIPFVCMFLPIIGHVIGALLGFAITITEVIMLLTQGERLGDRIANTMVIRTK